MGYPLIRVGKISKTLFEQVLQASYNKYFHFQQKNGNNKLTLLFSVISKEIKTFRIELIKVIKDGAHPAGIAAFGRDFYLNFTTSLFALSFEQRDRFVECAFMSQHQQVTSPQALKVHESSTLTNDVFNTAVKALGNCVGFAKSPRY